MSSCLYSILLKTHNHGWCGCESGMRISKARNSGIIGESRHSGQRSVDRSGWVPGEHDVPSPVLEKAQQRSFGAAGGLSYITRSAYGTLPTTRQIWLVPQRQLATGWCSCGWFSSAAHRRAPDPLPGQAAVVVGWRWRESRATPSVAWSSSSG
ncbi:hypothetical protein BO71DRAFT_212107 [Aspergillus ellipticus CBS 707.79]|uniref:Uncharacterized protein n=1 Tax=Aspergillus ellipticus CBS 707.79 TaxID=1448320 RepID=A0A319DUZ9_9EURO|nr:hypothetical protein BO71DRAFT_212107 [Aspergillus ellipticus CBS 707.79]